MSLQKFCSLIKRKLEEIGASKTNANMPASNANPEDDFEYEMSTLTKSASPGANVPYSAMGRIAVKVINHLGDDVIKVFKGALG